MNSAMIKQYEKLIEFLSKTLGPNYEITLHDLSSRENSIVAIANGHISGRTVGAPLTNLALKIIADKRYETEDYLLNYNGITVGNKVLRSSTLFIKDEAGKLVGLLCVNFDDSRYQDLSTQLLLLCHPDEFVDKNLFTAAEEPPGEGAFEPESFHNSISAVADEVLRQVMGDTGVPPERMTQAEKLCVLDALDKKGVFLLKGAVQHMAKQLCCSQASIYRYLSRLNPGKKKLRKRVPPHD